MLPLQFSAAPKLFPSFDDYCTIYCSSICSGILLLLLLQLASQLAFGSTTILLRRPNYREFRKLLLQLHSYIPSLSLYLYFCCPSTTTTSMAKKDFTLQWLSLHPSQQQQQWSSHTKEGATTQCYLNGQWRAPNPLLVIATNQLATASLLFTSSQYILLYAATCTFDC